MTYITKNPAYFSNLDGMRAICAEKCVRKKARPLRRSRASSPKGGAKPLTLLLKFQEKRGCVSGSALGSPVEERLPPLRGKMSRSDRVGSGCAGDDGRGPANKKLSRRAAASVGSRRGSCRLPLRPLPVKMQCRSVRRRSGIALLKIIFPLIMAKAHAAAI